MPEKFRVPGSKSQMIFFSTFLGSSTGLPSCHGERIPSISSRGIPATLKLCDLPILASQREELEWGCPEQSCSGLWLIFSSCFFSSDLSSQQQSLSAGKSPRAGSCDNLGWSSRAQRAVWLSECLLWQSF